MIRIPYFENFSELENTVLQHIGNTPLILLKNMTPDLPKGIEIWGKLESQNPGGSIKDRASMQMILDGLRSGKLDKSKVILDSTSGNTGIALAMIGSVLGIKVELCIPANVSKERVERIKAHGAKVNFSSPLEGSDGAIIQARQLYAENPQKYYKPDQYANPSNPKAHIMTTGPEIWAQTGGRVTHFVASIGTSGTIMGTGKSLKSKNKDVKIYAAEPDSPFHGLEGLKHMASSLVPEIFRPDELDGKIPVPTEPSYEISRRLAHEAGVFVGQSSGAAVWAARQIAENLAGEGVKEACIVTILCDSGERYYSKGMWSNIGTS